MCYSVLTKLFIVLFVSYLYFILHLLNKLILYSYEKPIFKTIRTRITPPNEREKARNSTSQSEQIKVFFICCFLLVCYLFTHHYFTNH